MERMGYRKKILRRRIHKLIVNIKKIVSVKAKIIFQALASLGGGGTELELRRCEL